ncbi:hypothetical protein J4468_03880 [Candidatus Woesearchaeota archaeon]|nr:hypothetical protein [Candidatus Woesearchaeota archaeon]
MVSKNDLNWISERRRNEIFECLDDLIRIQNHNNSKSNVITGYNWYVSLPISTSIVTFSNCHESNEYRRDMLYDLIKLGYTSKYILNRIREKGSVFVFELDFEICDESGEIFPGLCIKDLREKEFIDLTKYTKPLENYAEFEEADGALIAESRGWELDIAFSSKSELLRLVNLFLNKASINLYNEKGEKIIETFEEKSKRGYWKGAYETPFLIIGNAAYKYLNSLPHFIQATKFYFTNKNNEISFIIHNKLELLRSLPPYDKLLDLGFKEELCLGNIKFIKQYVDKNR